MSQRDPLENSCLILLKHWLGCGCHRKTSPKKALLYKGICYETVQNRYRRGLLIAGKFRYCQDKKQPSLQVTAPPILEKMLSAIDSPCNIWAVTLEIALCRSVKTTTRIYLNLEQESCWVYAAALPRMSLTKSSLWTSSRSVRLFFLVSFSF